jgi:hypothetical protein
MGAAMNDQQPATVHVEVGLEAESDAEELAELTARLQRQLRQLDVDAVDRPSEGPAPAGAKGPELLALGTLLVTLTKSAGGLTAVAKTVQTWLSGQRGRTVKLQLDGDTIELTGASSRDQDRLVEAWIERHARP